MAIVSYPDPRFAQKAVARPVDDNLRAIGAALLKTAQDTPAYGLAAVHIGEVAPVVVISTVAQPGRHEHKLLFNPEIIAVSDELAAGPEGSVSMPDVQVEIERPIWAEIAFDDESGTRQSQRFEGLPGRIAQHEIDQMNGVFFLARLSRLKRDMVLKKWKKRAG